MLCPSSSPISVVSLPARPEPMLGTRDGPTPVKESPAPHYIMVQHSLVAQYIVMEESLVPMSGVHNRPCLVVDSLPENTEDRAGTTSPVPMSGMNECPFLVDDSPAVPKVNNLCSGGENTMEEGTATLPINLVSPPSTAFSVEDPQRRMLLSWGGIPNLRQLRNLFVLPICRSNHLWSVRSHRSILWWRNPCSHPRSRALLVLSPLLCHPARGLASST